QSYRLEGLDPKTAYGVALRAEDEAGNVGPLSPPQIAGTQAPPDTLEPYAVEDLASQDRGQTWIEFSWTAPADPPDNIAASLYRFAYRYGAPIADEDDWAQAQHVSEGLPVPAAPGEAQTFRLEGLQPGSTYGFALRAEDAGGLLSELCSALTDSTLGSPPPPDTLGPEAITDLSVAGVDTCAVELSWTVPQDRPPEGGSGLGDYRIGILISEQAMDEERWSEATLVEEPLPPGEPGSEQVLRIGGLQAATSYTAAVKTRDGVENLSALSNAVVFTTMDDTPPPDTQPPDPIDDLAVTAVGRTSIRLQWTMTGDDGMTGTADSILAVLAEGNDPIDSEHEWSAAQPLADVPPPGDPGVLMKWTVPGLSPETWYALALRARDDAGHLSELGAPVVVQTEAIPDSLPPHPVDDLVATDIAPRDVTLRWTSPGDPDDEVVRYILARLTGEWDLGDEEWSQAEKDSVSLPAPSPPGEIESVQVGGLSAGTTYSFQVRARDALGHLGPAGLTLRVTTQPDPPEDDEPQKPPVPPAVEGLQADDAGEDWVSLSWLAPPDTGSVVISYVLGYLEEAPISDEATWAEAVKVTDGLPDPGPPGERQTYQLTGLTPGCSYGVAIRGWNHGGEISPLSDGVWFQVSQIPEDSPPAAVADLHVVETSPERLVLEWAAPPAGHDEDDLSAYSIGYTEGLITLDGWDEIPKWPLPPIPSPAGETERCALTGLEPGATYRVAVRSVSQLGLWSPLSNVVTVSMPVPDMVPPLAPGHVSCEWIGIDRLRLSWDPVGDPDLSGYHLYMRRGSGGFQRQTDEAQNGTLIEVEAPLADQIVSYAVTALDRYGLESPLSREIRLFDHSLQIAGPRPHPVLKQAEFRIRLGAAPGGSVLLNAAVFSPSGRRVMTLHNGRVSAGREIAVSWNGVTSAGRPAAPGCYFLGVQGGSESRRLKFFLLR
ncbi:MAG: hypothetical protein GF355_12225, partial [Candidatus Eisenbacteria bacterium]|nr:hypothetical protein [Candidatus Eisenbacteria bacterium]